MRFSQAGLLVACVPAAVSARFIEPLESDNHAVLKPRNAPFKIETVPGRFKWVTEDEKMLLKLMGRTFMDVTNSTAFVRNMPRVSFPHKCLHQKKVKKLAKRLDKSQMEARLQHLSNNFDTRYYDSNAGLLASDWILANLTEMVRQAGVEATVSVKSFPHPWMQHSVIATIPGRTNSTIVIGAHLDSINMFSPYMTAPGADDDGSGTVTIMEVFRALLRSHHVREGKAQNTIEFHWYSAEEGGLLGSQEIFQSYARDRRDVKAMLQQDMTGYVKGTVDAGKPASVGVISDYVDPGLTIFIKTVIDEYCDIPWVMTKCGYACSDHASASKAGYPSAFVMESEFQYSNPHIHSREDVVENLSFDHMIQHARMTLGLVYELGFHEFDDDKDKPVEL